MLSTTLLLLVAALNLVPGVVALRPKRTVALYGIAIDGPALALAMRHRAVLLTLVGVLLGVAAFDESLGGFDLGHLLRLDFVGRTGGDHDEDVAGANAFRGVEADAVVLVELLGFGVGDFGLFIHEAFE